MEPSRSEPKNSGAVLRQIRDACRLTQTEMAEEMELTLRGYQKLEATARVKRHYIMAAEWIARYTR